MNHERGNASLLTFGETMCLMTADEIGTLAHVRTFKAGIGGAESNVAIGATRLGIPTTWVGRVGADAAGDLVLERLRAAGINVQAVRDSSYTGIMMRHYRASGITHVDYHRRQSAGSHLQPDDIPVELIRRASIVHITGITPALSPSARRAAFHAAELAHDAGARVSLDINYRSRLWDRRKARPVLQKLAAKADIVFAGTEEAQIVTNETTENPALLAAELAELGPREVIIKGHPRGCHAVIDGTTYEEPGVKVPIMIDPVGAGDAFVAGYLAERLAAEPPEQCLQTAAATGAYAVTVPGDCELLPTRDELNSLFMSDEVVR